MLVDGDFVLWESRAINAYLASLRPEGGLYPPNPRKRAVVDEWTWWHAIHLGPAMQRVAFERYQKGKFGMGAPDESAIAPSLKELAQFLPVLDGNLADRDWVAGSLSLADFAIATTFTYRGPAGIAPAAAGGSLDRPSRSAPSWQAAVEPIRAWMAG